jgi:hypothetical protein
MMAPNIDIIVQSLLNSELQGVSIIRVDQGADSYLVLYKGLPNGQKDIFDYMWFSQELGRKYLGGHALGEKHPDRNLKIVKDIADVCEKFREYIDLNLRYNFVNQKNPVIAGEFADQLKAAITAETKKLRPII